MSLEISDSPLETLRPLLARYGGAVSLAEFHEAVNVVFHDMESSVYDEVHRDMWESLPEQYRLLLQDISIGSARGLRVLDIGCGTGLSSTLLLRELGDRAASLHLADTSAKMLERATGRLAASGCQISKTHGTTAAIEGDARFDLILTCSVLHHIPDLGSFCADVARLLTPGGHFLHFQDPCADSANSPQRSTREQEFRQLNQPLIPKKLRRLMPDRLAAAAIRRLRGTKESSYLDRVNAELIRRGVVARPMSPDDIWAVTDIHIGNGEGISIRNLAQLMPQCSLVSQRTYAFYSVLASSLPQSLRAKEAKLIADRSLEGSYVAAAWRKKS